MTTKTIVTVVVEMETSHSLEEVRQVVHDALKEFVATRLPITSYVQRNFAKQGMDTMLDRQFRIERQVAIAEAARVFRVERMREK